MNAERVNAELESPRGAIHKTLWVRRSDRAPSLYWWSLPLSLQAFAKIFAEPLGTARALVHPDSAVAACAPEIGAHALTAGVARVDDPVALLAACQDGRAAPCTIAIFPATHTEADLQRAAPRLVGDLERLGFTLAIVPRGEGGLRHRFCFRVPGKVLEAVEALALGRGFGGNLGQVEMALLQGLGLRPNHRMRLELVLEGGRSALRGVERGGRRRITYLESGKGFVGTVEEMRLREAVAERAREAVRRFPIGVLLFAGLPFFIAAFWLHDLVTRRQMLQDGAERG